MSSVVASVLGRMLAVVFAAAIAIVPAMAEPVAPLVSPQWLKDRLSDPRIVVLDIRSAIDGGGVEAYRAGHVPGAVHSDYDKAGWRVTRGDVPFVLPAVAQLEKLIGETGIDEDDHVVIVPAGVHATDFGAAARVYWTLKVVGHPAISILDGGYAAWKAAGYPVDTGTNPPSPKIFSARLDRKPDCRRGGGRSHQSAPVRPWRGPRGRWGQAQAATASRIALLDGRPKSFFTGKQKAPAAKAYGHIPGAINLDSADFYDPAANRLRATSELAGIAQSVPDGPVVSYCNTGHWAATNWFVLSELLGRKQVRSTTARWSSGPPTAAGRSRPRVRAGTT
jgi:thiosulfate/3-mercaptopyruvate sulfurtransferase